MRSWGLNRESPRRSFFVGSHRKNSSTLLVHPLRPACYVGDSVLVPRRARPIMEITGFSLQGFMVSIKELAEWFGLEVARIVVDECDYAYRS